jgi:hypothetical protein
MSDPVFEAVVASGDSGFVNSVTLPLACSAGGYVFAWALIDRAGTAFTDVKYNGMALAQLIVQNDNNQMQTALYGLALDGVVAPGTHNLVLTVTNANAKPKLIGATYNTVDQTTPIGTPASGGSSTGGATLTITLAAGELFVAGLEMQDAGQTMTIQNGTQRVQNTAGPTKSAWADRSGVGSIQINYDDGGNEWAITGVALKGATAGGGPGPSGDVGEGVAVAMALTGRGIGIFASDGLKKGS